MRTIRSVVVVIGLFASSAFAGDAPPDMQDQFIRARASAQLLLNREHATEQSLLSCNEEGTSLAAKLDAALDRIKQLEATAVP